MMKRLFDFIFALGGLLALLPVFGVVAVFVAWQSGFPVFFKQIRVGRGGRKFLMWKFRTMIQASRPGVALTVGDDARITPVGRILRKSKLDELPQLWNVLVGEMSLVGPRPEVPEFVELYTPQQKAVLDLRPGITDPASLKYFDEQEILARVPKPLEYYKTVLLNEKIQINLEYARRATLLSDVQLILATILRPFGLNLFDVWRACVQGALCLYLIAIHCSIAVMEVASWLTVVLAVPAIWVRRDFGFFKAIRWPVFLMGALVFWVFLGLEINTLKKAFWFQMGFMRWAILVPFVSYAFYLAWDQKFESQLIKVWVFCLIVTAAYGFLQALTGWDFVRPNAHVVYPQGQGLYKAVGFFSFSLTFAYMIGGSWLGVFPRGLTFLKHRWAGILFGIVGLLGVLSSMSRGSWLACLLCLGVWGALKKPKWILPGAFAIFATMAGLGFLIPALGAKFSDLVSGHVDHSLGVRFDLWRSYWAMFLDHPLFGTGLLEGDLLLPAYYQKISVIQDFTSHAHNNVLQWMVGGGLPCAVIYLSLVFWFLKAAWRQAKSSDWALGLGLACLFLQIGGLSECNFFDGEVNHLQVFLWALIIMTRALEGTRPDIASCP